MKTTKTMGWVPHWHLACRQLLFGGGGWGGEGSRDDVVVTVDVLACHQCGSGLILYFIMPSPRFRKDSVMRQVSEHVKFFCFEVEACCEHAITFVPVLLWRVTYVGWVCHWFLSLL